MAEKENTPNTTPPVQGLSLDDVKSLLADFQQLQKPILDLSEGDLALWAERQRIYENGLYLRSQFAPPEVRYGALCPLYTQKELDAWGTKLAPVKKRLDHLLRCVKAPLLRLSEMKRKTDHGRWTRDHTWEVYMSAVSRTVEETCYSELLAKYGSPLSDQLPPYLSVVIQDLERIQAKLDYQQQHMVAKLPIIDHSQVIKQHQLSPEQSAGTHTGLITTLEGENQQEVPNDTIALNVAVGDYVVSRSTLQRRIQVGEIQSYRKKKAAKNSPHLVSRSQIEQYYSKRLQ